MLFVLPSPAQESALAAPTTDPHYHSLHSSFLSSAMIPRLVPWRLNTCRCRFCLSIFPFPSVPSPHFTSPTHPPSTLPCIRTLSVPPLQSASAVAVARNQTSKGKKVSAGPPCSLVVPCTPPPTSRISRIHVVHLHVLFCYTTLRQDDTSTICLVLPPRRLCVLTLLFVLKQAPPRPFQIPSVVTHTHTHTHSHYFLSYPDHPSYTHSAGKREARELMPSMPRPLPYSPS